MNLFPESIGFIEVEHTADIAYAVTGDSIESLFYQSYLAVKNILNISFSEKITSQKEIFVHARTKESLLVAFLNEILYLADQGLWPEVSEIIFSDTKLLFRFDIFQCGLKGRNIKAVTYNEIEIINHSPFFSTMLVFDV